MNSSDWNEDIEVILDKIRLNSIIFSNKHTANHLYYMKTRRFFEIPVREWSPSICCWVLSEPMFYCIYIHIKYYNYSNFSEIVHENK